jgi:hypothetical protein
MYPRLYHVIIVPTTKTTYAMSSATVSNPYVNAIEFLLANSPTFMYQLTLNKIKLNVGPDTAMYVAIRLFPRRKNTAHSAAAITGIMIVYKRYILIHSTFTHVTS